MQYEEHQQSDSHDGMSHVEDLKRLEKPSNPEFGDEPLPARPVGGKKVAEDQEECQQHASDLHKGRLA